MFAFSSRFFIARAKKRFFKNKTKTKTNDRALTHYRKFEIDRKFPCTMHLKTDVSFSNVGYLCNNDILSTVSADGVFCERLYVQLRQHRAFQKQRLVKQ